MYKARNFRWYLLLFILSLFFGTSGFAQARPGPSQKNPTPPSQKAPTPLPPSAFPGQGPNKPRLEIPQGPMTTSPGANPCFDYGAVSLCRNGDGSFTIHYCNGTILMPAGSTIQNNSGGVTVITSLDQTIMVYVFPNNTATVINLTTMTAVTCVKNNNGSTSTYAGTIASTSNGVVITYPNWNTGMGTGVTETINSTGTIIRFDYPCTHHSLHCLKSIIFDTSTGDTVSTWTDPKGNIVKVRIDHQDGSYDIMWLNGSIFEHTPSGQNIPPGTSEHVDANGNQTWSYQNVISALGDRPPAPTLNRFGQNFGYKINFSFYTAAGSNIANLTGNSGDSVFVDDFISVDPTTNTITIRWGIGDEYYIEHHILSYLQVGMQLALGWIDTQGVMHTFVMTIVSITQTGTYPNFSLTIVAHDPTTPPPGGRDVTVIFEP